MCVDSWMDCEWPVILVANPDRVENRLALASFDILSAETTQLPLVFNRQIAVEQLRSVTAEEGPVNFRDLNLLQKAFAFQETSHAPMKSADPIQYLALSPCYDLVNEFKGSSSAQ